MSTAAVCRGPRRCEDFAARDAPCASIGLSRQGHYFKTDAGLGFPPVISRTFRSAWAWTVGEMHQFDAADSDYEPNGFSTSEALR
jgi:hypothetical protein